MSYGEGRDFETLVRTWCGNEWSCALTYGLRPVFKLNSDVKIKNGVGDGKTKDTAYELYL